MPLAHFDGALAVVTGAGSGIGRGIALVLALVLALVGYIALYFLPVFSVSEVTVAGRPMGPGATDAKAAIGLVPQDVALYEDLSAEENLRFFGRLQGLRGKALATRVAEALDLVGLADRAGDRVGDYSGGMKRRANIAAGLLHRPQLLMLDEPVAGMSVSEREATADLLRRISQNRSVIVIEHDMDFVKDIAHRVTVLHQGKLLAEGKMDDVQRNEKVIEVYLGH